MGGRVLGGGTNINIASDFFTRFTFRERVGKKSGIKVYKCILKV